MGFEHFPQTLPLWRVDWMGFEGNVREKCPTVFLMILAVVRCSGWHHSVD